MVELKEKNEVFDKLKRDLLNFDPVDFAEHYLTLNGKPYRINGSGYKPFCDIIRTIGIKCLEKTSKPVILVKSRQTSGSTMATVLEMYFMGSGLFGFNGKPPIRVAHCFPALDMAAAFSKTKFNTMINESISVEDKTNNGKIKSFMQSKLDTSSPTNDSLNFKQFQGGNHIWIESTGLTGDRLRGRSLDLIFFDEAQDILDAAISNSIKMLTACQYGKPGRGAQVYFGTPKRKGSPFHKMWQASSQQFYHLNCEKCHDYFPLYTPESDDWEKVWITGFIVECTKCGHHQNKLEAAERGKWISARGSEEDDCPFIGFHINQLYMPMFTKEDIIAEKPGIHPVNTERAYRNETLGEFFQGDASPITIEEIREKCGDLERKQRARIMPGDEHMVVMGIDYGAKADLEQLANPNKAKVAGQSYSTAVVLSVKGPNLLSIERALKFKKNDLESKKGIIDQLMRQYSVQLAVGDIGYSNDISDILHAAYGDKYLVSRAHNKINNYTKFNKEAYPKEIIFERDYYIGEMFELLKKGQVRFPMGDYEQISWLISHCASMEIKPSISRSGDPTIHYVKGGSPNDGLMSMINGYIAYKFLITNGFTNNNPLLQDVSFQQKSQPLAVLGYMKR